MFLIAERGFLNSENIVCWKKEPTPKTIWIYLKVQPFYVYWIWAVIGNLNSNDSENMRNHACEAESERSLKSKDFPHKLEVSSKLKKGRRERPQK